MNAENAFNNNRLPKEIYSDCRVTSEKKLSEAYFSLQFLSGFGLMFGGVQWSETSNRIQILAQIVNEHTTILAGFLAGLQVTGDFLAKSRASENS